MKIFGNTRVEGRIAADTGSFKIFGIQASDITPSVMVAGTDAVSTLNAPNNRSVIAHGQYDYIITSQNSGLVFDQAKLQAGSVLGFRVQHVSSTKVYTLRTAVSNGGNNSIRQSSINISTDGGLTFTNAYSLSSDIVAFDMHWINEDECFVVGAFPGPNGPPNTEHMWRKFAKYGLAVTTVNVNIGQTRPVIFKKTADSTEFVKWSEIIDPFSVGDCATAIAVNPNNPDIIIVGTENGRLYKSSDGGLTWSRVGNGSGCVNRIKFVSGDPTTVYAACAYGVLVKSTSSGDANTWQDVDINDENNAPLIVKTRDGSTPAFNDILVPNTTDVIVVGDDHTKILKSADGGVSWKFINTGIYSDYLPIKSVKSVKLTDGNVYHVGVSANKLFLKLSLNFQPNNLDDPRTIDWDEHALPDDVIDLELVDSDSSDDPKTVGQLGYALILTKSGLYEFDLNNRKLSLKYEFIDEFGELLDNDDVPQKLVAHSLREIYIITSNAKIIRGTKYNYVFGIEYKFRNETSSLTGTDLITIDTANDGRLYAGSSDGRVIYKSTGSIENDLVYSTDPVTWIETSAIPTGSLSKIIQVQSINHGTVLALVEDTTSTEMCLFKSSDTGSSWVKLYTYLEPVKKFVAYTTSSVYTMNQLGNIIYYTTNEFTTIQSASIQINNLDKQTFADYFGLDQARSADIGAATFLFGGPNGIGGSDALFDPVYNLGPWQDSQWSLTCISGEPGYDYWIGGGTTFMPTRGSYKSVGSEPILLVSSDNGNSWSNAINRLIVQEPPFVGNSGGDFMFASISEGQYLDQPAVDVFNVYKSENEAESFRKYNSNLYREDSKYPGNLNGIRKIRFYDSNFGVAVSDINQFQINDGSKVSVTIDGGNTWKYISSPNLENYNFSSVFITTQSISGYEVYITGHPIDESVDGVVFKSTNSGLSWTQVYSFLKTDTGLTYKPKDIFFINSQTGSISVSGLIDGSPAIEGIYRTTDSGNTWNFVTINDFGAGSTRGHIQFISLQKGYVGGSFGLTNSAGLFKTTDGGVSWGRLSTPHNTTTDKPVTALHFLNEARGVIAIDNQILRTTDSGSTWSVVHTLKYSGSINEIKFSQNEKLGIAVGNYEASNGQPGDHFVLKSINSGASWSEADSNKRFIDLEYELDSNRNLIGQSSNLYTIAFAEKINLPDEIIPTEDDDDDDIEDPKPILCIGAPFMSSSYYNFENFAYKCTPSGSFPRYYPNSSNNIGLGKGIFGQLSSVNLTKLRNTVTHGAALGVGALGKAESSRGDTATGFGAMDSIKNARNNVAIGIKSLSSNTLDASSETSRNINKPIQQRLHLFGLTATGKIAVSYDGAAQWELITEGPSTGSYDYSTISGSMEYKKIYTLSKNSAIAVSTDPIATTTSKTFIARYDNSLKKYDAIYSSSIYVFDELNVLTPSQIVAIDKTANVFLSSQNGGKTFITGSILNTSGNEIKSFKMISRNNGFIVGSKIWKLQSGSNNVWETSSYSGPHTLNAIDSLDTKTWFAVGTSGSIYKTSNAGGTWNVITQSITTQSLNTIGVDGSIIIAAGNSGSIIVSSNRGITWKSPKWQESIELSLNSFPTYNFQKVEFLNEETILVNYTDNENVPGIIRSLDRGNTWTNVLNFVSPFSFNAFSDGIVSFAGTSFSDSAAQIGSPILDPSKFTPSLPGETPPDAISPDQQIPAVVVDENVAVGAYTLNQFENSSRVVAIGANALKNIRNDYGSRIANAGISVYSDSKTKTDVYDLMNIFVKRNDDDQTPWEQRVLSPLPSSYGQVAIGAYSQNNSINSVFNTSIGYSSLYQPTNASNNTAIGFYSQHLSNNNRNTTIGVWSLGLNGNIGAIVSSSLSGSIRGGDDNVAIGFGAMLYNISSVRAAQILNAIPSGSRTNANVYRVFRLFGSRNIGIGNFAFSNVNGSVDTIAIGYNAVSTRGSDLTDSVFIGSYVGENFKTKMGTYYSSSFDNDWKFTQTVAVGSRTLQNQIGHDIVAIGANALRGSTSGSTAATPDVTISTEPYNVIVFGTSLGSLSARKNISRDFASPSPNLVNITDNYSPSTIDSSNTGFNIWEAYPGGKFSSWVDLGFTNAPSYITYPQSIAIADRNTAYAVLSVSTKSGKATSNAFRLPVLVRTADLAKAYDKIGETRDPNNFNKSLTLESLKWDIVVDSGAFELSNAFISNAGRLPLNNNYKQLSLNVPDPNVMYLLINDSTGDRNTIITENASGSYNDVQRRGILLKAISDCEFDPIAGVDFTKIRETKFIKQNKRTLINGTDNNGISIQINAMHFPSVNNGILVGKRVAHLSGGGIGGGGIGGGGTPPELPYIEMTADGGNTFSLIPFNPGSGSNDVALRDVWMNSNGNFACAVGNYGSIYTWTSESGNWTKQLGTDITAGFSGSFWEGIQIKLSGGPDDGETKSLYEFFSTPEFLPNYLTYRQTLKTQALVAFSKVKFYDALIGYAILNAPASFNSFGGVTGYQLIVAKTVDGGQTWSSTKINLPTEFCNQRRNTSGETLPQQVGDVVLIDASRLTIGLTYGQLVYTEDGGDTWKFTSAIAGAQFKSQQFPSSGGFRGSLALECDPYTHILCGDYKEFGGESLTISGSEGDIIKQTVTIGSEAQVKQKVVSDNVAIGYKVQFNSSGSAMDSVQIGAEATINANEIIDTVAVGKDVLKTTSYSDGTTAVGKQALFNLEADKSAPEFQFPILTNRFDTTSSGTPSSYNTTVGYKSGFSLQMGERNVFIGYNAGLFGNELIPTYGNNNIAIGANSPKLYRNIANNIAIGNGQSTTAVLWGQYGNPIGWQTLSDMRDKADTGSFATGSSALTFIRQLDVKQFKWDSRYMYPSGTIPDGTHKHASSSFGYIAQDIESAATAAGFESKFFVTDTSGSYADGSGSFGVKLISPGMIELMVYKAVKQLDQQVQSIDTALSGSYTASYAVTASYALAVQGGGGSGSGSLAGTNYIFVQANGTDTQNATELQTAYNTAKTMSPSSTNRITVVAAPGKYNFGTSTFVMDTQYIDLVSLDGNRSVIFNSTLNISNRSQGSISITANDVFVKGVDVQTKMFSIATNLNLLKIENCNGGERSFGFNTVVASGTFTNCTGGNLSFGGGGSGTASGTFTNCTGGTYSFGTMLASGTFTECNAGGWSFATNGGTASGTFIRCNVPDGHSFGGGDTANGSTASGMFINCISGDRSFGSRFNGSGGTASGTFINCIGGNFSFGSNSVGNSGSGGTASGTFTNCTGGTYSFGSHTASGTFTNCTGGTGSFGSVFVVSTLTGKLYYCRLTVGTFKSPSVNGKIVLCIDGNDDIINQTT